MVTDKDLTLITELPEYLSAELRVKINKLGRATKTQEAFNLGLANLFVEYNLFDEKHKNLALEMLGEMNNKDAIDNLKQ